MATSEVIRAEYEKLAARYDEMAEAETKRAKTEGAKG
jgi:hypothetical protein